MRRSASTTAIKVRVTVVLVSLAVTCILSTPSAVAGHEPLYRIACPGSLFNREAALSPDGRTLYVLTFGYPVNLWEVLIYYWPEIGGVALALAALFVLMVVRHIRRTPRLVGEFHCRKCNYCLRGTAAGRCPECFTSTRRAVFGRSTAHRALPHAIPSLLIAVSYGSLWAFAVPRTGGVSAWLSWWSYDAETAVSKLGLHLREWRRLCDRIVEIDTEAGVIRRTLMTRAVSRATNCPFAVTPDGTGIVMPLHENDALGLISTSDGRIIRSLEWPAIPLRKTVGRWVQIAGFDEAGTGVVIVAFDETKRQSSLIAWDVQTGEATNLLEAPADIIRNIHVPRRYHRLPRSDQRFLEVCRINSLEMTGFRLVGDGVPRILNPIAQSLTYVGPIGAEGDRGGWIVENGSAVFELDLETGTFEHGLELPTGYRAGGSLPEDPHGTNVVVRVYGQTGQRYLVANTMCTEWDVELAIPSNATYDRYCTSQSGRFFAGFDLNEIGIYDLRSHSTEQSP